MKCLLAGSVSLYACVSIAAAIAIAQATVELPGDVLSRFYAAAFRAYRGAGGGRLCGLEMTQVCVNFCAAQHAD